MVSTTVLWNGCFCSILLLNKCDYGRSSKSQRHLVLSMCADGSSFLSEPIQCIGILSINSTSVWDARYPWVASRTKNCCEWMCVQCSYTHMCSCTRTHTHTKTHAKRGTVEYSFTQSLTHSFTQIPCKHKHSSTYEHTSPIVVVVIFTNTCAMRPHQMNLCVYEWMIFDIFTTSTPIHLSAQLNSESQRHCNGEWPVCAVLCTHSMKTFTLKQNQNNGISSVFLSITNS